LSVLALAAALQTTPAAGWFGARGAAALSNPLYAPLVEQAFTGAANPQTRVNLLKGPTLIYTGQNTSMRIFWQHSQRARFRLDWGLSQDYELGSALVDEYDPLHHLYAYTIDGLQPGQRYVYRIVREDEYASGSLRSAPPDGTSAIKFVSYGDTRTLPDMHNAVAGQVLDLIESDPQYQTFNLFVGDWVSNGDLEANWEAELFAPRLVNIRALLGSLAFLPAMGNHEASGGLFQRYFPIAYTAARYGSFNYGPLHVAIVDQYVDYSAGSAQIQWLQNDLAAATQPWKFVVLHQPGWSAAGGHPNTLQVQQVIQPILEANGVQALFAGHNHFYARALVNGVTHLTVGTGGAPLVIPKAAENVVAMYAGTGYARFEIEGDILRGTMIGADGLVKDTFTISR